MSSNHCVGWHCAGLVSSMHADDLHRVHSLVQIFHGGEYIAITYMAHMLRGKNSRIANMLRKGEFSVGVCEHVFDYMNKIEDMFHAEGQTDRFAKKGRSCFGHSFTTLAPDGYNFDGAVGAGSLLCVNIRQFCNDSKQDFEHSLTLLDAAIELFVEACPFAHTLNGSKDGAVNFGFEFNLAYPRVLEKHGLMAGIIDTPETGSGKDEEDQDFRQVQCALRLWVNGGGDVLSAEDATDAADQLQGPEKGKLNVLTTIKRGVGPLPLVKEKFIAGRLYRYHHHFNDEVKYTGTTVHKYAAVVYPASMMHACKTCLELI